MPTVEKVEFNINDNNHNNNNSKRRYKKTSQKYDYSATLNLVDTSSLEFKLDTCGSVTDEGILKETVKHINIWPKIIVVETNNRITIESISTLSLCKLIDARLTTLDARANNDRGDDGDPDDRISKKIIETTKARLECIKSALPTIIVLQAKEWKITEMEGIQFTLSGHEGLQDLVSVFDVKFEDWVSKTLSVVSLDTEAVFYPHLDIMDIVLDHNALLSTYKWINTRLERHVIFRLSGVSIVITSPLYSGKTSCDILNKMRRRKHDIISTDRETLFMIEGDLYENHHSIERIRDILAYYQQGEDYSSCIRIDKQYRYSVEDRKKKPIPLMLTKGFVPGYTSVFDADADAAAAAAAAAADASAATDDNDEYDNDHINDEGIVTKKQKQLKTVDFLVSCAIIENARGKDKINATTDKAISKSITSSEDIEDLLKTNKVTIQSADTSKLSDADSSSGKIETVAIFNNYVDASRAISQGRANIRVDIQIDGTDLPPSAITGLNATNGSSVFRGGGLVADSDGRVRFRPVFDECFPERYYRHIPIRELVSYLLDLPPRAIIEQQQQQDPISHDRYQPTVKLLYEVLFEKDVEKYAIGSGLTNNRNETNFSHQEHIDNSARRILNKMNELTLLLSRKLFGVCTSSLFADRLWNSPHWDFPVGVIVCLYGMLSERLGDNSCGGGYDSSSNIIISSSSSGGGGGGSRELWRATHEAVLVRLLMPVFDAIMENGVWVASRVRSFMAWIIEGVLLPLLNKKTASLLSSDRITDIITSLAFQWVAVHSAANNKGLCKCFPNRSTWFYIEPNKKMIDYVYSPIPKFILSDHIRSSEVSVTSKTLQSLIQKWSPSKGIRDRIFAIRNLVMPIRRSLSYSFTLNSLNGMRVIIKGLSPNTTTTTNTNGDDNNNDNNNNNDSDILYSDEDDISPTYNYTPPLALSDPNARLLSLGTLRDLKMLDSSLSVVWDKGSSSSSSSSSSFFSHHQLDEIITKAMKQDSFTISDNDTDTIKDKYITVETSKYNINYWMSQLSTETLKLLTEKKESVHSFIDGVTEDLPLDVVEEMASPITKNRITFHNTDNEGFSWLFDYGLRHNLVKLEPDDAHHRDHISDNSQDKLDKLLSIINNLPSTFEYINSDTIDHNDVINTTTTITTTTNQNNRDNNNMRTLVPFQFLEHIRQYHHQRYPWNENREYSSSSSSFNIDSTLVFIYKKLPEVLESIMLRIMLTSEPEEKELVRKLTINVSRILADSLLIGLDPRNALNVKKTLEEAVTIVCDETGAFSLHKKGGGGGGGERRMLDETDNNSIVTEILSSSNYVSLINKDSAFSKNTLLEYLSSLNSSQSPSSVFNNEEREIIDRENSPVQKNIKTRRGLENVSQTWTDENINRPYIVPTFQGKDGNRFALLANMPDNLHIYVPALPTSFLMAEQIKSVLELAKDKTKHLTKHKESESTSIKNYKDAITKKFVEIWGVCNTRDKQNQVNTAIQADILSALKYKQKIAIKNKKLLSSLPFSLDIHTYFLHLAIRNITDIDYYVRVPNFWRIMNIEEMLRFAIGVMLITLKKLVNVGLNTAKRLSDLSKVAKNLHEAEKNVMF